MASSRYTVKLKVRPFYPWHSHHDDYPNLTLLYKAWVKFVEEQNKGWVMPVTGRDHVSQTVVSAALREYNGRIGKEFSTHTVSGQLVDWYRYIEFKEGEGLSMFILRYGHEST